MRVKLWLLAIKKSARSRRRRMRMLRWICGVTRKDKIWNELIRDFVKSCSNKLKNARKRLKIGNVIKWLKRHECDQYDLGSKPLVPFGCVFGKKFHKTFPVW